MAARVSNIFNHPTVKLADTEAGLSSGEAYECQITSFVFTPAPVYNTIAATGCAGATQSPGLTGWGVDVAWLQDLASPGGGLSKYTVDNDTQPKWVMFTYDSTATDPTTVTANVFMAPGQLGGTFGDGSAGVSTANWPFVAGAPDIVVPAVGP